MTKILVTYDMFREGFTELESKYEVTFPEGRDFTYEEVLEMIPEYDVLCSMFDFPVNKELIDLDCFSSFLSHTYCPQTENGGKLCRRLQ